MPLIVAISSLTPCGIAATAARSSALLKDPVRRLPEIPTIVVMALTSSLSRDSTPTTSARGSLAVADLVVNRAPATRCRDERIGGRGAARAGLVELRRLARIQQWIDDTPSFEHAVLAREQRAIADERGADEPLVRPDFLVARVADEKLDFAAAHLRAGAFRVRAQRDCDARGAEPEAQVVRRVVARKHVVRRTLQRRDDLGHGRVEELAGAQIEGHAGPTL